MNYHCDLEILLILTKCEWGFLSFWLLLWPGLEPVWSTTPVGRASLSIASCLSIASHCLARLSCSFLNELLGWRVESARFWVAYSGRRAHLESRGRFASLLLGPTVQGPGELLKSVQGRAGGWGAFSYFSWISITASGGDDQKSDHILGHLWSPLVHKFLFSPPSIACWHSPVSFSQGASLFIMPKAVAGLWKHPLGPAPSSG